MGGKGERRDGWSGGGREGERMEGMAEEREETITCSMSKVFLHKITTCTCTCTCSSCDSRLPRAGPPRPAPQCPWTTSSVAGHSGEPAARERGEEGECWRCQIHMYMIV